MSDEKQLRVSRIESGKQIKEKQEELQTRKKNLNATVIAAFSTLVKKVLTKISEGEVKSETRTYGSTIYAQIKNLRESFSKLTEGDQTKNSSYTQQFSERWNRLFAEFMHLSPREPSYKRIDAFIKLMNSYPSADEHALGFYLTHYAGETWLPFPYLEILKKLHRDFLTQKEKSDLHTFLSKLSQILGDA